MVSIASNSNLISFQSSQATANSGLHLQASRMTVRQHLAEEVVDFLPEMVSTGIQQANMEHRRQHLERITQLTITEPDAHSEQQTDSE